MLKTVEWRRLKRSVRATRRNVRPGGTCLRGCIRYAKLQRPSSTDFGRRSGESAKWQLRGAKRHRLRRRRAVKLHSPCSRSRSGDGSLGSRLLLPAAGCWLSQRGSIRVEAEAAERGSQAMAAGYVGGPLEQRHLSPPPSIGCCDVGRVRCWSLRADPALPAGVRLCT